MKKTAGILLILLGFGCAAAYWIDLMNFTDLTKGFVQVGSVWLRYSLMALLLLLAALGSRLASPCPAAAQSRHRPTALALALCAAAFAAVGGLGLAAELPALADAIQQWQLVQQSAQAADQATVLLALQSGVLALVQGVLALALAGGFALQARAWFSAEAGVPAGGVGFGVLGSLYFLVLTFARFAGNYSSVYRFAQTMQTFSALAALLLSTALLWVMFFPEKGRGRRLYLFGMWAFYLCTCCEVPQALARWGAGQTTVGQLAVSLALGCLGLLGAAAAMAALSPDAPPQQE